MPRIVPDIGIDLAQMVITIANLEMDNTPDDYASGR